MSEMRILICREPNQTIYDYFNIQPDYLELVKDITKIQIIN